MRKDPVSFFGMCMFIVPFIEESVLSLMCVINTFIKNKLALLYVGWLWILSSAPPICGFMPKLYCFDCYGFVVWFKLRYCDTPRLGFIFLRIAMAILALLWYHINFRIAFFVFLWRNSWYFDRYRVECIESIT